MHPGVAHRDALLADVDLGRDVMAIGEVFAERHGSGSSTAGKRKMTEAAMSDGG
jgi:hypothetical protein